MIKRIRLSINYRIGILYNGIKRSIVLRGAESDFWARMYYAFFDKSFVRENRAVLQGKIIHQNGFQSGELNEYKIRRNIHRLEKGLIMPERRSVFAKDYIMETVKAFVQEKSKPNANLKLIEWAQDVLSQYFNTVEIDDGIAKAKLLFDTNTNERSGCNYIPHTRDQNTYETPTFDIFLNLCRQRVSTRLFQDRVVDPDLIKKALTAAITAPSACNRQPFEYLIFTSRKDIDKYIKLPGGISGFDKNVPILIFLIGDLSAYFDERDRHLIYIDGGLTAMNFMLALETLGLGSCALNWPDIEEKEMQIEKQLKLPKHKRCIMALIVGYPAEKGGIAYSLKKTVDQISIYKT